MPDFANSVSTRSSRVNIRLVSTAIALVASAMLLGAGVYESVVVAPNFHGAPASLQHARRFYHATNPGMLFMVLSPAPPAGVTMQLAAGCRDPMEACCRAGARDCIRRDQRSILGVGQRPGAEVAYSFRLSNRRAHRSSAISIRR